MKKYLLVFVVLCSMIAVTNTGWAYLAGSIDVGGIDSKLFETKLGNSGAPEELAWVNGLGLGTFSISDKYDTSSGGWLTVDNPFTFAYNLTTDPAYFLIKIGTGSSTANDNDTFLFQNQISNDWAVINLADLHFGTDNYKHIQSVTRISHIDEFGGTSVPESATLLLFGSGLLGLGIFGRKGFKK